MRIAKNLLTATMSVALMGHVSLAFSSGTGIVRSIVSAPVVPDGNVAGAIPELVINLDISPDPNIAGRALLTGKKVTIVLPEEFLDTGSVPVATPFTPGCIPGSLATLECNTAFLLQGFPQHNLGFPPPTIPTKWSVSSGGQNVILIEALQDFFPAPPLEPGLKQIHLLLKGYIVPRPGHYEVQVIAETGPGGTVETGSGDVEILPQPKPSINVVGLFNPGAPNTIYQHTTPGQLTPLPYDFLLWDQSGMPMLGVEISDNLLVQNGRAIGQVSIEAPAGAVGQDVLSVGPSMPAAAPVTGFPTARLTAQFRAGSLLGEYVVRFHIAGGNGVEMFVHVQ